MATRQKQMCRKPLHKEERAVARACGDRQVKALVAHLARYKKYPAQGNAAEGTGAVSAREPSGPSSRDRVSSATCAAISRKRRAELVMTEHKFKIGQLVYFQPGSPDHARPGPYQIVRRLPSPKASFTT